MRDWITRRRQFLRTVGTAGALGLAGCTNSSGGNGNGSGGGGGGGGGGTSRLTYGGTVQGTTPYQFGLTWAQELKKATDLDMSVQTTGGFDANIRQVGSGAIDVAASTTPNFQAADKGVTPFENKFDVNLLFTSAAYPFPIAFTTTATDIDYIEDCAGKKIATGAPGSSTHTYLRLYFLANGLDWEATNPVRISGEEAFQNLSNGQVSAVVTAGVNNIIGPSARQFLQTNDSPKLVVPDGQEPIDRLVNARKYIDSYPLTGGVNWKLSLEQFGEAWKNSAASDQQSYPTVAGTNTHFATLDVSDEVAKQMVSVAIEQRESLAEATGLWGAFAKDPGRFATLIPEADAKAQPWHPGAAAALQEHDLWDDSLPVAER